MLFSRLKKKERKDDFDISHDEKLENKEELHKGVAIIGISARFPDARNYNKFWENIKQGKSSVRDIPIERWDWKKYHQIKSRYKNRFVSHTGCFMDDIDKFDLRFFQLSQREADAMDPQQRMLLEEAWSCFEDAGICPSQISGSKIGVYVAGCQYDYRDLLERNQETIVPHSTLGIAASLLANRISFFFNLKGPSVSLDTACAGTLTSIHYAVEAIEKNECSMALAGGVNAILSPNNYIRLSKMLVLSPTGELRAFDEKADGYIRGEGAGLFLLKSLDRAIEDKDPIYGVIKGTAINHCGKSKSISYPNSDAQADVIIEAVKKANIPVESIGYVELHGTGTPKGDPVEFEGLQTAFSVLSTLEENREQKKGFCGLGSVKTNIGHLEGAAGVPSIVKVLMSMKYSQIPKSLNFNKLNPAIHMEESPFYYVDKLTDWKRIPSGNEETYPLRAGISSFGLGGVNAHIILEEYCQNNQEETKDAESVLICLSAKTEDGLRRKALELKQFLECVGESSSLQDISYTLCCGREHFEKRIAFAVGNKSELIEKLKQAADGVLPLEKEEKVDTLQMEELESDASKEVLSKVAQFYMQGNNLELESLFSSNSRKIHLPTYSFEPTKCWIPDATNLIDDVLPLEEEEDNLLFYQEQWEESKQEPVKKESENQTTVCVLIPKGYQIGEKLKQFFVNEYKDYIYIEAGTRYQMLSDKSYVINSTEKEDYVKVFEGVRKALADNCTVIDLLPMGDRKHKEEYEEIMYLLQAISTCRVGKMNVLIAGTYSNESERCYLESLIGFEKSAKMAFRGCTIKIVLGEENLEEKIAKELCIGFHGSVLYEQNIRKVLRKRELKIENRTSALKQNGIYLVTGGAGGLGAIFAKHLLETYKAHVYLIGRSSENSKRDVINRLEQAGGKVCYIQADVSYVVEMEQAVKHIVESEGRIDGVIHAAGIYQGKPFRNKEKEEFERTLKPKVLGVQALEHALEKYEYDFICYCSSVSAIVGDMGDCDYSIANLYMKAYAEQKNAGKRRRHIVIHWPIWKDGGMELGSKESVEIYLKSSGQELLEHKDGIRVLEQVLSQNVTDVIVFSGEKDRIAKYMLEEKESISPMKAQELKNAVQAKYSNETANQEDVDIEASILDELKEVSSNILKFPKNEIYLDSSFADLGYDSVNLLDFAAYLSNIFHKDFTPDLFFRYPNLKQLKDYLLETYSDVLKEKYRQKKADVVCAAKEDEIQKEDIRIKEEKPVEEKESIAIIGMSGVFPGADSVEELWEIIEQGKEVIKEIPPSRISFPEKEKQSSKGIPWRMGMIKNPAQFDPLFFEISPGEAETMDPRQRILLEQIWYALEDAQLGEDDLEDAQVGTFVGVEDGDYRLITGEEVRITSNHNGVLASRLAYYLNLKGPCMAINTACSSGLSALHQACLSLKNGDCDIAVVAGAAMVLRPETYLGMTRSGMIAEDGICYTFDKRANGMVPGESVAVIVLKRQSEAKKDHNYIHASILGTGINYDGKTNGITAPNGKAQADLYRRVYKKTGISPKEVDYIVTHGTATKLGDPIEINGIDEVFREASCEPASCAITSVKPNIGHTLAASGIVSVISLVLAMKHKIIPASIHCEQPSNYMHWEQSPLYVNTEKKEWGLEHDKQVRVGAVNAFGVSGTNVHAVLASYEDEQTEKEKQLPCYLLTLSAKSRKSLKRKIDSMIDVLKENPDCDLSKISFVLLDGRYHFKYRCVIMASNVKEAIDCLETAKQEKETEYVKFGEVDRDFYENSNIREALSRKVQTLSQAEDDPVSYMAQMKELSKYYCQGYRIKGKQLFGRRIACHIKLPNYPFDNRDYWCKSNGKDSAEIMETKKAGKLETVEETEERFLEPVWKQVMPSQNDSLKKEKTLIVYAQAEEKKVFETVYGEIAFCELNSQLSVADIVRQLSSFGFFRHIIYLISAGNESAATGVFRFVKAITELGYAEKEMNLSIVTNGGQSVMPWEAADASQASADGFAAVLSKEVPNWNVRIYDVDRLESTPANAILSGIAKSDGETVSYRRGQWYRQELVPFTPESLKASKYRQSGIYVVVGGAGGVGYIWTQYMVENYNAQVIWIGRRELNQQIRERMSQISKYGREPVYIQGDVTDRKSLNDAYEQIKLKFDKINGIIHSAVGSFDRGIMSMDENEFQNVLQVKTKGVTLLDEIFGGESLDFVLYFSSLSSFEKTRGQSGYVAGCSYVDAFARQLQSKVNYLVRTINWGFWGNVGAGEKMPESIKINIGRTGARPLQPQSAMEAVELLLSGEKVQLVYTRNVKKADNVTLKERHLEEKTQPSQKKDVSEYCYHVIISALSEVLKMPEEEFDRKEKMERYGLDSITILQLIRQFQKVFPDMESTVFYEYTTIEELEEYILANYKKQLETEMGACESKPERADIPANTVYVSEKKNEKEDVAQDEPIAVIGMSGKFPKAENLEEFWENLQAGRDCVTEIPSDRWDMSDFYNPDIEQAIKNQQSYVNQGGFIDGYADFDPQFFKISPAEAMTMDPMERYLLEECWKTFEDAGYTKKKIQDKFKGNIGVFVGVTRTGFGYYGPDLWNKKEQTLLCTSFSSMSNRLSYVFDLNGPCMSIDTMCSSSLTALHEACEHIRRGECEMALLGGANIYTHPITYKQFCQKRMLSPTGKCHAFGAEADGFIPGEGVGVILLKPLSKAIRDKDQIYSVIRSTAVNHGGKTSGYTVPNPVAQKEMILTALQKAGVHPEEISYIEAHGTGTKLGDPIEINGLTKAFRNYTDKKQYCAIGSVKTNIGHCEAASGLAGVLKVILQMKHGVLVPSLHAEVLNPLIDFKNSPFYVQRELSEWKRPVIQRGGLQEGKRIAGISSFGAGGSNAHVIIEEYVE